MANNWIMVGQIGSTIRRHHTRLKRLRGLGLFGIRHVRLLPDIPEIRDMIRKVQHLVHVFEGPLTPAMTKDLNVLQRFNRRVPRTEQSTSRKCYVDKIPNVVMRMDKMKLERSGPVRVAMQ